MKKPIIAAAACSAALAMSVVATGASQAASPPSSPLTWARINAMTPDQIAALQNPLIATADPISSVGSTEMASVYSSVTLDTPAHAVDLYVTDTAKAPQLLQAAKNSDPNLNLSLVRVMKSAYSMATLYAAADRLISASVAGHTPFRIYAAAQVGNGQGLQLQVPDPVTAQALSIRAATALGSKSVQQLAGVTLTFAHGVPIAGVTRENDSNPFIGGDYTSGWNTPDGRRPFCTAGIAVENSSGQDGLIQAGHCVTPNNGVYTLNGSNYVGQVGGVSDSNDSEIIWTGRYNGVGSNADEGESDITGGGINYHPLVDTHGFAAGEYVCQDGINSYYYLHRATYCNLQVQDYQTYALCPLGDGYCGPVNGVRATSNNGKPVNSMGDSGAVVFTIHSSSTRDAVGMVDAEPGGCDPNCTTAYFILANNIYGAFGVHLNPHV